MNVSDLNLGKPRARTLSILILFFFILSAHRAIADEKGCASATTADTVLTTANSWRILRSCGPMDLTNGRHFCQVTACADVRNPRGSNTENRYRFALINFTVDGPVGVNLPYERAVELNNNSGVDDPDSAAVCTTRGITFEPGTYSIGLYGRKWNTSTENANVADVSISAVCVDVL